MAIIKIATQIGMSPSSIFFIILELIVVESFKKLVEFYDVVIEVILASAVAAWDIISDVQTQYLQVEAAEVCESLGNSINAPHRFIICVEAARTFSVEQMKIYCFWTSILFVKGFCGIYDIVEFITIAIYRRNVKQVE